MIGVRETAGGVLVAGGAAALIVSALGGWRPVVWIGAAVLLAGMLLLLAVPVAVSYHRWARPRFSWGHQIVQTLVIAGAAVLAGFVGRSWVPVVIVVAACLLVGMSAGAEGRTAGRRMEIAAQLERQRRQEADDEVIVYGDEVPPWERDDLPAAGEGSFGVRSEGDRNSR